MNKVTLWIILIFISILGVTYVSGSNSRTSEPKAIDNQTPNIHSGQIQALPINSPVPTKVPITSKAQLPLKKPSQWASVISAYFFLNSNKLNQNELLKKFSDGTNNLVVAQNNFALAMDSNPKLLKEAETLMFLHMSKNMSGYNGTAVGSGHDAGYEWAEENGIDNIDDCGGNSDSFIEGCQSYVEENYPPEECEDGECEEYGY